MRRDGELSSRAISLLDFPGHGDDGNYHANAFLYESRKKSISSLNTVLTGLLPESLIAFGKSGF